mmetsp:Transcript_6221/g.15869  ORF Transcript_6221/g.15869 Transcript_6221/m.15869 type:complete len:81 (+) Transcript_6221:105-347(+)
MWCFCVIIIPLLKFITFSLTHHLFITVNLLRTSILSSVILRHIQPCFIHSRTHNLSVQILFASITLIITLIQYTTRFFYI